MRGHEERERTIIAHRRLTTVKFLASADDEVGA